MKVTTRINDEEVKRALDTGAKEEGSRSEAVRKALKRAYNDAADDGLGDTQRDALQALEVAAEPEGWINVDSARATVANRLNIPKETVRNTVFEPLRRHDKIAVARGMTTVRIIIR